MDTKRITHGALLAAILYAVYFMGSFVPYLELVSFVILLYGTSLPRNLAWYSALVFSILVILTKGLAPWSLMYIVVFPQYVLIYNFISKKTTSEYAYAFFGAILSFFMGSLIQLPYFLTAGLGVKELWVTILLGFQVSIINAVCTVIATLFLYKPLNKVLKKSI